MQSARRWRSGHGGHTPGTEAARGQRTRRHSTPGVGYGHQHHVQCTAWIGHPTRRRASEFHCRRLMGDAPCGVYAASLSTPRVTWGVVVGECCMLAVLWSSGLYRVMRTSWSVVIPSQRYWCWPHCVWGGGGIIRAPWTPGAGGAA